MKPYVKNIRTGEVLPTAMRPVSEGEQGVLVNLLSEVGESNPEGHARDMLQRREVPGIFACGELCAACALTASAAEGEKLAASAGMSKITAEKCAELSDITVHPDYSGNGLEREIAAGAVEYAWSKGSFFVLTAVRPADRRLLMSLMSIGGMRVRCQARLRGGHLYYILCAACADNRLFTEYNRFSLDDTYGITKGFEDGYEGISTFRSDEGEFIWLAK